jgi:hypothetical protein
VSEEGASEINRKQNTVSLSARSGGELKSRDRGRINRVARRVATVYAGFELELAGASARGSGEGGRAIAEK